MLTPALKLACNCGRLLNFDLELFSQLGFKALPKQCPTCGEKFDYRLIQRKLSRLRKWFK